MSRPWRHLYKTAAWQRLRAAQLAAEPLCKYCEQQGRDTEARVCDHIVPHKGDHALFFDPDNLQSLCKDCHDGPKQREEHKGLLAGGDVNGYPTDPRHHWNTEDASVKKYFEGRAG